MVEYVQVANQEGERATRQAAPELFLSGRDTGYRQAGVRNHKIEASWEYGLTEDRACGKIVIVFSCSREAVSYTLRGTQERVRERTFNSHIYHREVVATAQFREPNAPERMSIRKGRVPVRPTIEGGI